MEELARKEREFLELQAEREYAAEVRRTRTSGPPTPVQGLKELLPKKKKRGESETPDAKELGVSAFQNRVLEDIKVVAMVATKSLNLKSTYVRPLKDAAQSIASVVEALALRSKDSEVERLENDNERLHRELETLKGEMGEVQTTMGEVRETINELGGRKSTLPSLSSLPPPGMDVSEDEGDSPLLEPRP